MSGTSLVRKKCWRSCVFFSSVISFLLLSAFCIISTSFNSVTPNIMHVLSGYYALISQTALAINMLAIYPMSLFVSRNSLIKLISSSSANMIIETNTLAVDSMTNYFSKLKLTISIICFSSFVSLVFTEQITMVVELCGLFTAIPIAFVIPSLLQIFYYNHRDHVLFFSIRSLKNHFSDYLVLLVSIFVLLFSIFAAFNY